MRFAEMNLERHAKRLDTCMKEARSSGIKERQSFVDGMEQDNEAVKAGLSFH